MRHYFTPYEVPAHNSPTDCWVSVFDKVYDLTPLIKEHNGAAVQSLLENAGQDVTHWFDAETADVRTCICPESGQRVPYCPQGRFLHVPPPYPSSNYDMSFLTPWWKDSRLQVGILSKSTRVVRFQNMLTKQEDKIEVPEEESISEIRKRYLQINRHAHSYSIKSFVKNADGEWELTELDLNKTLTANGVLDERERFENCSLPGDSYTPVLLMYWMDDLTVM